jgi:hypothetical protein
MFAISLWTPGTSLDSLSGAHAVAVVHKRLRHLSCTGKLKDSARDIVLQKVRSHQS